MAAAVDREPELQLVTQALSIATFRFVPARSARRIGEEAIERIPRHVERGLLDRLQRGGEAFVSNAVVGGRYVLRACIVNFHTRRTTSRRYPGSSFAWAATSMPGCARLPRECERGTVSPSAAPRAG